MKYYGIIPKRKLWVKMGAIIFSVYTAYSSILNNNLLYLPFGIVLIIATFSNRKHIISDQGIDIVYIIFGMQFHNLWSWNEVDTIHIDSINSKPSIELHIGKNIVARRIVLLKSDADKIISSVEKINSKIYISEINKK
ncbi:MAG: hypothetical protein Q4B33_05535 [Fusobacterium sp.]|nr:hypothetical protein [Fusobacterium sp.]